MSSRRKICVVTTSRADFGLLHGLLGCIHKDSALRLQIIASGMHLAPEFGRTVQDLETLGLRIDRRIDMRLSGNSDLANAKSIGLGLTGFADALTQLKPSILVMLGDRFELLAAAVSALMLRIPIAHTHGGERSEGAIDESVRHAITKMATLHFAATEPYRRRIIQMGESPSSVFNFGAPGLDELYTDKAISRQELENEIGLSFENPVALVTYHPATLDRESVDVQIRRLTAAIKSSGFKAIFTMANADAEGARINAYVSALCARSSGQFKWFPHLGRRRYLGCLRHCSIMVGNSSSGLTEAPSFQLPVVNVGDRQRGRIKAANVIDVRCSKAEIFRGIKRACSSRFRDSLRGMRNPYDRYRDGRASERIKEVLKRVALSGDVLKKQFHDVNWLG